MTDTYLYYLNFELIKVIISNLTLIDLYEYLKNYEHLINWKDLFVYKFPNKIWINFSKYNPKNLYLGFMDYQNMVYSDEDFYDIDFGRYVTSNKIFDIQAVQVARANDIIIYENIKDNLDTFDILEYSIIENSLELVEYILKNIEKNNKLINQLKTRIIEDHINFTVTIEMFKLLLKYLPEIVEDILLGLHYMNILDYLLNNYKFNYDIILKAINRLDYTIISFLYMKTLIEKFYDLIKDDLVKIYENMIDKKIEKTQHYKIIIYLANLDIIKQNYHI